MTNNEIIDNKWITDVSVASGILDGSIKVEGSDEGSSKKKNLFDYYYLIQGGYVWSTHGTNYMIPDSIYFTAKNPDYDPSQEQSDSNYPDIPITLDYIKNFGKSKGYDLDTVTFWPYPTVYSVNDPHTLNYSFPDPAKLSEMHGQDNVSIDDIKNIKNIKNITCNLVCIYLDYDEYWSNNIRPRSDGSDVNSTDLTDEEYIDAVNSGILQSGYMFGDYLSPIPLCVYGTTTPVNFVTDDEFSSGKHADCWLLVPKAARVYLGTLNSSYWSMDYLIKELDIISMHNDDYKISSIDDPKLLSGESNIIMSGLENKNNMFWIPYMA